MDPHSPSFSPQWESGAHLDPYCPSFSPSGNLEHIWIPTARHSRPESGAHLDPLPVILAAAGIWSTFGSLLPVILAAAGIQSPFPHPTWFVSAGMFQLGRQPVCPARLIWGNRLRTQSGLWIPAAAGMTGNNRKTQGNRILMFESILTYQHFHPEPPTPHPPPVTPHPRRAPYPSS